LGKVNEIICDNAKKLKLIGSMQKTNKDYMKTKRSFERDGMFPMDFRNSMFRTTTLNDIIILKDNSLDYIREDEIEKKFVTVKESPEDIKKREEEQKAENIGAEITLDFKQRTLLRDGVIIDKWRPSFFL